MLATVTQATNDFAADLIILAMVLVFVGAACVAQAVHAAWNGERLLRSTSRPLSSVRSGHVVVSGVVEPAWAVLKPPFSMRPSVWFDAKVVAGSGKSSRTVFHKRNAVPFILNDGSGRVLVLGRRARWDAATSLLDLHGYGRAKVEGDTPEQIDDLLSARQLQPIPEPLQESGDVERVGSRTENVVEVGERVTVIGRAAPDDRAQTPDDACLDDGASFGLPGLFRVGPERLWGLDVTAGSARDVTVRGRVRLMVGLLGMLVLVAAGVSGSLALTSHVLPSSGTIVFGTSFSSWSGMQGQEATLSPGQPIVAVADFNGDVKNGDQITVLIDGHEVVSWTADGGKDGPGACEIDFGPQALTAGQHRVDVLGPSDAELASGTVAVGN